MHIDKGKARSIIGITAILAGLLLVPPLAQRLFNISAIKVAFGVIILYAAINYVMKKRRQ